MSVNLMAKFLALFLLAFSWACARHGEKEDGPDLSEKLSEISDKTRTYWTLIAGQEDDYGWIMTDECDALLFSGLTSAIGRPVVITAARDASGQWYRRPLVYEACYKPGKGSTISRDMFLGLLWHLWRRKDLATAEALFTYGANNNWIMGEGEATRIYFTPGMQATLAEIVYRLGGQDRPVYRALPQAWFEGLSDFPLHLQTLHILLRGEMIEAIGDFALSAIRDAAAREPNNPLVQFAYAKYVTGDYERTADLLLTEAWWPAGRLPTNHDRKTEWLTQRRFFNEDGSINPDWLPVAADLPEETHSGGDYLFVAKLLLERFQ